MMEGICNGKGRCVSVLENPCSVHGCEGKLCGERCLMGDIQGWCDSKGECISEVEECPKAGMV